MLRVLGTLVLALQDQNVAGTSSESAPPTDIISLVTGASPTVQAVMAMLVLFSAISWGIVIYKKLQLRRAASDTQRFLEVFRKSSRFSEVQGASSNLAASPLVGLFQAGYAELNAQVRGTGDKPAETGTRPTLKSLDAIDRSLLRASSIEIAKLEYRVPFLATTASITPYIGLFGTVWGIMTSFQGIAAVGSTSLSVVAPGIAEALIATALGLFAAIPAVYFYNDITSQVKKFANVMDEFSMEFLTIVERNFT